MLRALEVLQDLDYFNDRPRDRLTKIVETSDTSSLEPDILANSTASTTPSQPNQRYSKPRDANKVSKRRVATLKKGMNEGMLKLLDDCKSLADLRTFVEKDFECELKKTAMNTVFADGKSACDVMVIGEAPGAEEDKQVKPFVGQSGQLLTKIFKTIGLDREDLYITNIVPWRPPGNRTPTNDEVTLCLPVMHKHIELLNPKIIVLLGGVPTKALLDPKLGIMKQRGHLQTFTLPVRDKATRDNVGSDNVVSDKNYPCLASFHPAYLLRSPGQKRFVWQDMCLLKASLG